MAEGVGPGVGSWGAPGGAAGAGAAALEACKAGGWACSVCCWAEESESLSLSWGLGMLGDVLRLSWSMSLGSLLPSSLTLRLSELSPSPSDGELGRLISWVFVFLELVLSASSVSEATFSRWRLVFFSGDEASSFTFLADFFTVSALLSLLEVLAALGELRPLERMSSLMGEARPSGLAGCFFRPLRSVDIEPRVRRVLMLCFPLSPSSSSLTGLNMKGGGSTGFSMGGSSPYFLKWIRQSVQSRMLSRPPWCQSLEVVEKQWRQAYPFSSCSLSSLSKSSSLAELRSKNSLEGGLEGVLTGVDAVRVLILLNTACLRCLRWARELAASGVFFQ